MHDVLRYPQNLDPPVVDPPVLTKAVRLELKTPIDLLGDPNPERLEVDGPEVVVRGAPPNHQVRRRWRLDCVSAARVESTIGSSFLQIEVDGQWSDVVRRPGIDDEELATLVAPLEALCRPARSLDGSRPADEDRTASGPRSAPRSSDNGPPSGWHTTRRILSLMGPFHGSLLLLLGLSLGAVAIEVAPPMLQRILVDRILQAKLPRDAAGQLFLGLAAIVVGLLLVRLAAMLISVWKGRVSSRVGTTLTSNLRNELVQKLNELPLAFHDRNQVGMLMSRVAYDTETLHTLIYHITSGLLLQSLQMAGIGVMLVYLNPKLALVTMLPMPLILAGSWYFTRYLNPRHHHYWEAVGRQASALTGMLSGIRVVKAFVQEDREVTRFRQSSHCLRDSRQTVDFSTATFTAVMAFVFALGSLAVWYIGGRDVLAGGMSLGSLMAFLAYLAMFYTPLTTIAEATTWFSSFFTTSQRIFELLDTPGETEDLGAGRSPDRAESRVELQNVSFSYQQGRPVLKDVSFTIQPGEMIGVVGRSGSGKSTLVSLIGRLYELRSGRILVGGVDVRDLDPRELRRRIGMVPQEPFLFRGLVAENIAYGNMDATPDAILRAAAWADAHDFIMRMPLAYENQLGEGGLGLSGGERQRLSIARALLFDPAILILDEATASVDAESERAICRAIRRFSRSRTTIAIAHRLSTLQEADRLLVFDQGRLIEQGTPQELVEMGGVYSTLASLQSNLRESRRRIASCVGTPAGVEPGAAFAELGGEQRLLDSLPASSPDGERAATSEREPELGLRWLDPSVDCIKEGLRPGSLHVVAGGRDFHDVFALRTFPASHERCYLSLRRREPSERDVEVGMVRSLDDWPAGVQEAVVRCLGRRYLLRRIEEIRQVQVRGNELSLAVLTAGGPARVCLHKPGEGVQPFGDRGLLLIDGGGNYYVLPDRAGLPRRQRRLLALYFGD